ncbi:serine protease inhibitor A6-like isoform 1-T2 [Discoglossus pictus]
MKFLPYLSIFICLVLASDQDVLHGPQREHKTGHDEENTKVHEDIASANLQFGISMYKHIATNRERKSQENIFFSPASISMALSMLSVGAKSTTYKQILEGLNLNETHAQQDEIHQEFHNVLMALNKPKSDLQVHIGNAVFLQENLKVEKSFEEGVKKNYHAEIQTSDFTHPNDAKKQINDYVKDKTEGKIKELVKDLDDKTKLVLLNYILFKGEWENPFNPHSTHVSKFFVDDNTTIEVQMMSRMGMHKIFQDDELPCIVLQLPYKNNAYMLLVIPDHGKIHEIEKALSGETIARWKNSTRERFTHIYMPKFSIRNSIDLKSVLSDMGMAEIFDDTADFSGITEETMLKVSKATHKAILDVDEKGTEAAAATDFEIFPAMILEPNMVNRPFITLICSQETNSLLFVGTIMNPTAK